MENNQNSESLLEKLKSLRVNNPEQKKASESEIEHFPIEKVLAGEEVVTGSGNVFLVQQLFRADFNHGVACLGSSVEDHIICEWAKINRSGSLPKKTYVFLDTETSGLSGGTGTFAFLIGLGFQTPAGFQLMQLFMRDPGEEPALLTALSNFLRDFDTIVSFNGRSFDVPILVNRHVLWDVDSPFSRIDHIDLLHLARRIWRNRLPSRALSNLEKEILGVARTEADVPGWMIPELYFDYLKTEDARPLKNVFYHNAMDILSLAGLYFYLSDTLSNPNRFPNLSGFDLVAIAKLYEDLGRFEEAAEVYETGLSQELPPDFFVRTIFVYASLFKRQAKWQEAVRLWNKAANLDHIESIIELSKYYEHVAKDHSQALFWAKRALEVAGNMQNLFLARMWRIDIQKRIARLAKK